MLPIDFEDHKKLVLGMYEAEINRFIRELSRPGMECFDVGGQLGYHALVLAKLTRARVACFEADAALAARLETTLQANDLGFLVTVENVFVASETDRSSGRESLDAAAQRLGLRPGCVKVDVDGGELDVLRGSTRLLREGRPNWIVETHSRHLELCCGQVLEAHGYRVTIVNQRRWLRDHRPIPHNRWLVARPT